MNRFLHAGFIDGVVAVPIVTLSERGSLPWCVQHTELHIGLLR